MFTLPSKGISIHKQANDDVVHFGGFREADRLANQAFIRVRNQMLALDFLGVPFARAVHVRVEMPLYAPQ